MAKSKRNKVVALTKTKKRTREQKGALMEEIRASVDKYKRVLVITFENERNNFWKVLRPRLRPGRLFMAKNKQMQLALRDKASGKIKGAKVGKASKQGLLKLADRIVNKAGLLFTDSSVEEVKATLAEYQPADYARAGALAMETVTLPRGKDALAALPHSIEAHLRQCGMPTQLIDGKIHLLGDHTICKQGEKLSTDAAQLLKLLDLKQANFCATVEAYWTKGGGKEGQKDKGSTFVEVEDAMED